MIRHKPEKGVLLPRNVKDPDPLDKHPRAEKSDAWPAVFLGTAQLSRRYGVGSDHGRPNSLQTAVQLVRYAERNGFGGLDTASIYGRAEADIGLSGSTLPVFTKLAPNMSWLESLQQSKQRLKREFLDCVFIHEALTLDSEQTKTIQLLHSRKGDDIGAIGASIYEIDEFHRANENPNIDVIQLPYSVLDRRFSQDFLQEFLRPGKQVFARSVLLQGFLTSSPGEPRVADQHLSAWVSAFQSTARDGGATPLAAALAFVRANQSLAGFVVGTSSRRELWEISSTFQSPFPPSVIEELGTLECPPWNLVDPRKW